MDHTTLFEAVKALIPHLEFCIGVEMWGNSSITGVTWQIYISEPGVFFRGPTPEAAFEAFKVAYAPAAQATEAEQPKTGEPDGT